MPPVLEAYAVLGEINRERLAWMLFFSFSLSFFFFFLVWFSLYNYILLFLLEAVSSATKIDLEEA